MYITSMDLNKKYITPFVIFFMCSFTLPNLYPKTDFSNNIKQLLNINRLDHNFSFSMGTGAGISGPSSFYSIGDRVTYNFSDKLLFVGDFDLIFSSSNFNQFGNSFDKPKLNFDLGFKYNINENTNFQLRIIKNSANPNYNTLAF